MQLVKNDQELHRASGIATQVSSVAELMALPAEKQGLALMRYLKGKTVEHVIAERDQVIAIEDELRDLAMRLKEAEANYHKQLINRNQEPQKASGISRQLISITEIITLPTEEQGVAQLDNLNSKIADHVIAKRDLELSGKVDLRDLAVRLREAEDTYQIVWDKGTDLQARLASMAVEELLIKQDETTAFITCGLMLEDCFTFFGVTAGANAIESLAYLIVSEFGHHLNATELGMVLRDGKAGKFGKLYGKLDANQIVEWIKAYLAIRQQKYADRNLNKHLALRPASDAPRKSGTLRELFDGQGAYKSTQPK